MVKLQCLCIPALVAIGLVHCSQAKLSSQTLQDALDNHAHKSKKSSNTKEDLGRLLMNGPEGMRKLQEDPKSIADLIADKVLKEILGLTRSSECDPQSPKPEIVCGSFVDILVSVSDLVFYNSCQPGSNLSGLISPILEVLRKCDDRRLQEPEASAEEEDRELRMRPIQNLCVKRFDDGNYDGLLENPRDIPKQGITGEENKYGWGANFNNDLGIGVILHSAGGLALIEEAYSLPTFTLRDRNANIIYKGVYSEDAPIQTGLRSTLVLDKVGSVVTILAATVGDPLGSFVTFELDLNDYNGIDPVRGIAPKTQVPLTTSSVRALKMLNKDIVLYAPLFDFQALTDAGTNLPTNLEVNGLRQPVLRLYNWKTATDLGVQIKFEAQGTSFLEDAFIWDFKCFEDGGLCWVNIIELVNPPLNLLDFSDQTVGRSFTFNHNDLYPIPNSDIFIPVVESDINFDIPFSVVSYKPISTESSLVCTLSGFVFALVLAGTDGDEDTGEGGVSIFSDPVTGERRSNDEVLKTFELGFAQECNMCTGQGTSCKKIAIKGQKRSSVYIWVAEECGGKVFAGTNDQSSNLSILALTIMVGIITNIACRAFVIRAPGPLGSFLFDTPEECVPYVRTFLLEELDQSEMKLTLQLFLINQFFANTITERDFGFDLYSIDTPDLMGPNPTFEPVTLDGFRDLDNPSRKIDDGVRNLICHKQEEGSRMSEKLILGSTVFGNGFSESSSSSSTFVLNVNNFCGKMVF